MPQADLSYSADLDFDAAHALDMIEGIIHTTDPSSGACKGRAHPIAVTHNSHILLKVHLLKKPHRDDALMNQMCTALVDGLSPLIPPTTTLNVELCFLSPYYQSNQA